jgi:hypothetical protein
MILNSMVKKERTAINVCNPSIISDLVRIETWKTKSPVQMWIESMLAEAAYPDPYKRAISAGARKVRGRARAKLQPLIRL